MSIIGPLYRTTNNRFKCMSHLHFVLCLLFPCHPSIYLALLPLFFQALPFHPLPPTLAGPSILALRRLLSVPSSERPVTHLHLIFSCPSRLFPLSLSFITPMTAAKSTRQRLYMFPSFSTCFVFHPPSRFPPRLTSLSKIVSHRRHLVSVRTCECREKGMMEGW